MSNIGLFTAIDYFNQQDMPNSTYYEKEGERHD